VTREELLSNLSYDPETGHFTWLSTAAPSVRGKRAGNKNYRGYVRIWTCGELHLAHRLAFVAMIGKWPKETVDHINGEKDDNRWSNLREATYSQNSANRKAMVRNKAGIKGVSWCERDSAWRAYICARGERRALGSFQTKEEAAEAYARAAKQLHGEFART
jgi:hypothetical protein